MLPTKFQVSPTFSSGEEAKNIYLNDSDIDPKKHTEKPLHREIPLIPFVDLLFVPLF